MLQHSFFTILKHEAAPGSVKALLSINKDHEILKGHFPGQPIVPGVCMMQMVKEILECETNRILRLTEAENMKFLSVIDPRQNSEIEASVLFKEEDESISLNASLFSGSVTFFKLKAVFRNAE
jgi:3-hydroxyacyl-[acyl-carrier-protein] dehydratase